MRKGGDVHLGVEDAGLGLDNAHGAIEGLNVEEVTLAVRHDSGKVQTQILGVHLGGEAVADALLGVGGDLNAVAGGSQVTDRLAVLLRSPQATADKVHGDWVGLIVGECDKSLGRVTIDQLDAEDLRSGERRLSGHGKGGDLLSNLFSILHITLVSQLMKSNKSQFTSRQTVTERDEQG